MTTMNYRLRSMPSAQAHVVFNYKDANSLSSVELWSYSTRMLSIVPFGCGFSLTCHYSVSCSKTTARHVNRFTTELFGTNKYFELKKLEAGQSLYYANGLSMLMNFVYNYEQNGKKIR